MTNHCIYTEKGFTKILEQFDDLLLCSHQECTTSSSYLLNKKTIEKVYNCVLEGYNLLCKKDSSADIYCIDRYWTKMNKDNKMFIFSRWEKTKIVSRTNFIFLVSKRFR